MEATQPLQSHSKLTEDETVGFEKLTVRPGTHAVHGAWLQIDQHSTGNIFSLVALIVVDIDALQLEFHQVLIGTCVLPGGLDAMFVADNFPELQRIKMMVKFRAQPMSVLNYK
ncbi:hypothetical protein E2C01_013787 [Portunus trituberculatus]|uniref:Uncharacterized protein n=1 Tax=Portunus trituberculatus TaxID=210409 RepID=A0A5B7DID5_PORTR|nr:hypothetical protein [Portunus trituberculatus]